MPAYIPLMALTPKQEAFCQAYLESGNASAAYRLAYNTKAKDAVIWGEASALLQHPMVSLRIKALQGELAAKHAVTRDSLTAQLFEDRQLAYEMRNPSAAIAATMALAKLHGLLIQRAEITAPDKPIALDMSKLTDAQLEALEALEI